MGETLIRPFAAVRPRSEWAPRICAPPYDVVTTEEARRLAAGNPLSFLWVSRPEIAFPPGTNPYAPEVYEQGRRRFEELLRSGALFEEDQPAYYIYRLRSGAHEQIGLVAVASCEAYLRGDIRKHELTRPDKENDRTRHIEVLNAQTGPAYLVYRALPALDAYLRARTAQTPDVDFQAPDGVRHTVWPIRDSDGLARITAACAQIPRLYIADGHHRTAAAVRVCQNRRGSGRSAFFLAALFPHDQLQILPYHRLVRDWGPTHQAEFLRRLSEVGDLGPGDGRPPHPHQVDVFTANQWHRLHFREVPDPSADPLGALDVSLLQARVLGPLLGIDNPRTDARLEFVGGVSGPETLEAAVRSGRAVCAFALHATRMEELLTIADRGEIMPPKSTWFEPKLGDGLFSHRL